MVGFLLDKGAELEATCEGTGNTALLLLASSWHHPRGETVAAETVAYLLERGASPFVRNNNGKTALMCVEKRCEVTIGLLKAAETVHAAAIALKRMQLKYPKLDSNLHRCILESLL
jgi:hypothetical protein